jgi:hypothetical protein
VLPDGVCAAVRVRRALKCLLRSFRLRCTHVAAGTLGRVPAVVVGRQLGCGTARRRDSAFNTGHAALLSALRWHEAGLPRVGPRRTDADRRPAGQLVAGAGRQRCEEWARRGVAALGVRPDPSTPVAGARSPRLSHGADAPHGMRKTIGICPATSLKSNRGRRTRRRNPIAVAPRFSPTRIYPECSARKPRHTRPVHPGGALRIAPLKSQNLLPMSQV